jgi:hypothetical protein
MCAIALLVCGIYGSRNVPDSIEALVTDVDEFTVKQELGVPHDNVSWNVADFTVSNYRSGVSRNHVRDPHARSSSAADGPAQSPTTDESPGPASLVDTKPTDVQGLTRANVSTVFTHQRASPESSGPTSPADMKSTGTDVSESSGSASPAVSPGDMKFTDVQGADVNESPGSGPPADMKSTDLNESSGSAPLLEAKSTYEKESSGPVFPADMKSTDVSESSGSASPAANPADMKFTDVNESPGSGPPADMKSTDVHESFGSASLLEAKSTYEKESSGSDVAHAASSFMGSNSSTRVDCKGKGSKLGESGWAFDCTRTDMSVEQKMKYLFNISEVGVSPRVGEVSPAGVNEEMIMKSWCSPLIQCHNTYKRVAPNDCGKLWNLRCLKKVYEDNMQLLKEGRTITQAVKDEGGIGAFGMLLHLLKNRPTG